MARKTFDELVDEFNASESEETPVKVEETPAAEETPAETETPSDEPPKEVDKPEEKPVEETKPAEEAPKPEDAPKSDPVIDEIENTNSTIRKRLEKQAKSYEQKLADKDAEWQKKIDELKAQFEVKKPVIKTRKDFEYDEDYIQYLNKKNFDAYIAEKEAAKAEADRVAAEKKAEEDAAAEEIRSRQTRFMNNIEQCFDGDERQTLLARLKYATSKGFGELLDANPAASDYLLSSPKGPLVLQKLLDTQNPEYFRRVFPAGGINPLEQFAELKEIERTVMADRNAAQSAPAVTEPKPTAAKLGRPGAQGAGGTGGDPMADPKSRRDYVRNLLYGHK